MKIRLYLDEDTMDKVLTNALRMRGADVVTAYDAKMIKYPDIRHLEYAALHERVVYSFNVADYCILHAEYMKQDRHHAGIILAQQQRYSAGEQMRRLLRIIGSVSIREMKDNLIFLSAWG